MTRVDRRGFIAGAAAAGLAATPGSSGAAAKPRRARQPPLGSGGTPMELPALQALAREQGAGRPILFCDLAALDQNLGVVLDYANSNGWAVRPALKVFRSPRLIAYVLQRLPEPRGLVFNLSEVDAILAGAPAGADLMLGYPPTFGELAGYLGSRPHKRQKPHTLRLLVDSVPLMEELGRLVRTTRRALPLDVALEFDVGMGKGGIGDAAELEACLAVLRAHRERLRLGAVLGYDGHATLDGDANYRKLVAAQAQQAYRDRLAALADLGGDLYDAQALIRNGPASSNYRNWDSPPAGPANEMSPGSAFLFAGYLGGYDNDGLHPAITYAGALRRITSDHPSVPAFGQTVPGTSEMEVVIQGVGPAGEVVIPGGAREDTLSGGGDAMVVPKGSIALGEYMLFRPVQTEAAIVRFDEITAVRNGTVRRRWPTFARPGARA